MNQRIYIYIYKSTQINVDRYRTSWAAKCEDINATLVSSISKHTAIPPYIDVYYYHNNMKIIIDNMYIKLKHKQSVIVVPY